MMFTESERSQIKLLISSPHWQTVERVANALCEKIAQEPCLADTEWGTVSAAVLAEGKVRGIRQLFQELFDQTKQ